MPDQISNISTNNVNHSSGTASEMTTCAKFIGLLDTVVNRSFDYMNKHTPAFLATGAAVYCVKNQHYFLSALCMMTLAAVSDASNISKQKSEIIGIVNKRNGLNIPQKTDCSHPA